MAAIIFTFRFPPSPTLSKRNAKGLEMSHFIVDIERTLIPERSYSINTTNFE